MKQWDKEGKNPFIYISYLVTHQQLRLRLKEMNKKRRNYRIKNGKIVQEEELTALIIFYPYQTNLYTIIIINYLVY